MVDAAAVVGAVKQAEVGALEVAAAGLAGDAAVVEGDEVVLRAEGLRERGEHAVPARDAHAAEDAPERRHIAFLFVSMGEGGGD